MTNLQFIHTSPGYIGVKLSDTALSLNSHFFMKFWTEKLFLGNEAILFPQRVPRSGFFAELKQFEPTHFQTEFESLKSRLIKLLDVRTNKNQVLKVNVLNALIRMGNFEFVISYVKDNHSAELQYLKEIATVNLSLSHGNKPTAKSLLELFEKVSIEKNQEVDLKLKIANRFIVSAIRYRASDVDPESIQRVGLWLVEALKIYQPKGFKSCILKSMCHRGISMLSTSDVKFAWYHLEEAMKYALNASTETEYDDTIKKENLLNLHQSFSKAYAFAKDIENTERHLIAMAELDNNDSVVHLELGLFYFNNSRFTSSLNHFTRALKLGPPSLGMNAFFVGKSNLELGNLDDATEALRLAVKYDDQAVSPLLELFQIFKTTDDSLDARKIAKQLLETPSLKEQLEPEEITELEEFEGKQL